MKFGDGALSTNAVHSRTRHLHHRRWFQISGVSSTLPLPAPTHNQYDEEVEQLVVYYHDGSTGFTHEELLEDLGRPGVERALVKDAVEWMKATMKATPPWNSLKQRLYGQRKHRKTHAIR